MRIKRERTWSLPPPLKITKTSLVRCCTCLYRYQIFASFLTFLSNSGPERLTIRKALMLGHYQHTSKTSFKWRFAGGLIIACPYNIWILLPLINLKNVKIGPPLTKSSGSVHACFLSPKPDN